MKKLPFVMKKITFCYEKITFCYEKITVFLVNPPLSSRATEEKQNLNIN